MIHGLPPPSASYEKYFFVQSQLALRGGPGIKKRNVLHQSIPIHYKTTECKMKKKNQLDVKKSFSAISLFRFIYV